MKLPLSLRTLLTPTVALVLAASASSVFAQTTATTEPVGYYKITLAGASDNLISIPMARDAVFAGTVGGSITSSSFTVLAGASSPNWTASQYVFASPSQLNTYYVEFTSGALRGLFYKISANTTNGLTLTMNLDSLTLHPLAGNATAALAVGDSLRIRPYWRIRDVFESAGVPLITPRTSALTSADEILIPNYLTTGVNKPPALTIFYQSYAGVTAWRALNQGTTDYANYVLEPNDSIIVRRKTATSLDITSMGGVLMNRGIAFIGGGNGSVGNDTYISINRPAPVKLDDSGLWNADQTKSVIKSTTSLLSIQDTLLEFGPASGMNKPPANTYFYSTIVGNVGWRKLGANTVNVGQTVLLQPGLAYIVRKKPSSAGTDWINDPNY